MTAFFVVLGNVVSNFHSTWGTHQGAYAGGGHSLNLIRREDRRFRPSRSQGQQVREVLQGQLQ